MKRLTTIQISLAVVLLSWGATGCHDPRITIYDFVKLQEEYATRDTARMKAGPSAKPAACSSNTATSNASRPNNWVTTDDNKSEPNISTVSDKSADDQAVPYYDASRDTWVLDVQQVQPSYSAQERYQPGAARGGPAAGMPAPGYGGRVGGGYGTVGIGSAFAGADMYAQPMPEFGNYVIGQSDVLRVSLTGLTGVETLAESTMVMARVNSNGEVNLPLVGAVKIGGMNIETAERTIRDAYVPAYVPAVAVSIDISQYASTDILVVGAAITPGFVQLPASRRDLAHAVAAAGGMTQDASGWVTLQRAKEPDQKVRVYLRDSFDLKSVLAMDPLEAGDVVTIEAAQPNAVYIGGLVNFPGTREFPPGVEITMLQALAAAGGTIEALLPVEGTLIRRMPDGEDVQVKIDLERLKRGQDPNIKLAAGDIFWVPETAGTKFADWCNRTFFVRAGATVSYNVTGIEFLNRPSQQVGNNQGGGGGTLQNSVDPLGFLSAP